MAYKEILSIAYEEILYPSLWSILIQFIVAVIVGIFFISVAYIFYFLLQKILPHENIFEDSSLNKKNKWILFWELSALFLCIVLLSICIRKTIILNYVFTIYFLIIALMNIYIFDIYTKTKEELIKINTPDSKKIEKRKTIEFRTFLFFTGVIYAISLIYYFVLLLNEPTPNSDFSFSNIINIVLAAATISYAVIAYSSLRDNKIINQRQAETTKKQLDFIEISQLENKIKNLRDLMNHLYKIQKISDDIIEKIDDFEKLSKSKDLRYLFREENKSLKKIGKKMSKILEIGQDDTFEFNIWIIRFHLKFFYCQENLELELEDLKGRVQLLNEKSEKKIEELRIGINSQFERKTELEETLYR